MSRSLSYRYMQIFFGVQLLGLSLLTLYLGDIPWQQLIDHTLGRLNGTIASWNPLLDERIPRLIVIVCSGSALAVAGAVMQALFQNPLASPGILGLSSGSTLFVISVFLTGLPTTYPFAIPAAACIGSLATLLIVYFLATWRGSAQTQHLIMTGIAISTLLLAVQSALLYALRDHWQIIQTLTEISAASTLDRTWKHVHMQLPLTLIGLAGCFYYRREIDLLTLGDEEAYNLGVDVKRVRWRLFLCIALLTGGAIAGIGMVAFLGLILPHLLRRLHGPENRSLIPLCATGGASLLLALDLGLRVLEIHAFTIGTVTSVLGGALFVLLLMDDSPPSTTMS